MFESYGHASVVHVQFLKIPVERSRGWKDFNWKDLSNFPLFLSKGGRMRRVVF